MASISAGPEAVGEHVAVYDDVQRRLAAAMDDAHDQPTTGSG